MSPITETSAGCPRSELDPFSDEFLADPFPFLDELREVGPVVHLDRYGAFAVARHDQVQQLTSLLHACTADDLSLRNQIDSYAGWLKDAQRDIQLITTSHHDAEKTVQALQARLESQAIKSQPQA